MSNQWALRVEWASEGFLGNSSGSLGGPVPDQVRDNRDPIDRLEGIEVIRVGVPAKLVAEYV